MNALSCHTHSPLPDSSSFSRRLRGRCFKSEGLRGCRPELSALSDKAGALPSRSHHQRRLVRRACTAPSTDPDSPQRQSDIQERDPFVAAALRLQNLIRGIGSIEEEHTDKLVANEPPESKLQTSAALGGLMCAAAAVTVMLCTNDLRGSIPDPDTSISWAAVGALAGLPLVGLRLWSWSPAASQSLPALEDMHRAKIKAAAPWFHRMSRAHVMVVMAFEVLPMTLLLLPAAQGLIAAWSGTASALPLLGSAMQEVGSGGGGGDAQLHELAVRLVGLLLTASVAAVAQGMELSLSEEEHEVVQAAMDNADRYYRLVEMDVRSRGADAERSALAFKCVAKVYLESRSDASLLAGALTFFEIMFLGGLWYATGMNVAAPAAAALASNWVEYFYLHQAVEDKGDGSGASKV